MRLFISGVALVLCTTTALAQEPSRWTISAGPEWAKSTPSSYFWGVRLRAEYDLTKPSSVFGLRVEGGARWGPTQSYFYESGPRSQGGVNQSSDLMLGLSGAISPFPRGRF